MDKKRLHHWWTIVRSVRILFIVIPILVSVIVTGLALRANNLTMVELRQEVYAADEQNGDIEGALQRLRTHVYGHMNTEISGGEAGAVYPPIQLKYTYQRLKQAEQDRVSQANEQVYTDAQNHCEALYPGSFSGGPRVPCIEGYVNEHGVKEQNIPDALYKFDFVSPRWSPDIAGYSMLLSILLSLLLIARLVVGFALKRLSK